LPSAAFSFSRLLFLVGVPSPILILTAHITPVWLHAVRLFAYPCYEVVAFFSFLPLQSAIAFFRVWPPPPLFFSSILLPFPHLPTRDFFFSFSSFLLFMKRCRFIPLFAETPLGPYSLLHPSQVLPYVLLSGKWFRDSAIGLCFFFFFFPSLAWSFEGHLYALLSQQPAVKLEYPSHGLFPFLLKYLFRACHSFKIFSSQAFLYAATSARGGR